MTALKLGTKMRTIGTALSSTNTIDVTLFRLQRDVLNDYLNAKANDLDTSVYEVLLGLENLLDTIYDGLIDDGAITLTRANRK